MVASVLISPPASAQKAPIAGNEVNMVSGITWPGGDPFLQRQNEPSIAVSSENDLHLLAGANDYRTVDVPMSGEGKVWGDAWLGVFKSYDGGQRWQSVLLPGYPQDRSPEGLASPLKGFTAGADPTVRAATDGLLYYSGIVFNRGSNRGQVFVARFIDLNDKENGDATATPSAAEPTILQPTDPIRYLDTFPIDSGTAGLFMDKPWLAVDIPRGTATCTVTARHPSAPNEAISRTVKAGIAYIVYSTFTGTDVNNGVTSAKIMLSRTTDCGATWSKPIKVSESQLQNQGTAVAVDPITGAVYVTWRRFAGGAQGDAIMFAKSTDFGLTFSKATVVANVRYPFDQPTLSTQFRVNSLPTMAVSVATGVSPKGKPTASSYLHVAWTERLTADGDARVLMATSANGGGTWSAPAQADPPPSGGWVEDSSTNGSGHAFGRAHQVMPALTFTQGRLMLAYYDTRLDHTRRYFKPTDRWDHPERLDLPYYDDELVPLGELLQGRDIYTRFIDDAPMVEYRHTIDVRAGSALAGAAPQFKTSLVTHHLFGHTYGTEDDPDNIAMTRFNGGSLDVVKGGELLALREVLVNPPNLPLFNQGTMPFIGDYLDIAGQMFAKDARGNWTFNTAYATAPVHHAVWTTNQDVRKPGDGDWTHYTPISLPGQAKSFFDGTQLTPCLTGQEGMRNQNVYTSRLTEGLVVSSPQNVKPLGTTKRGFVVTAQNTTGYDLKVRFIARPPNGVSASFLKDGVGLVELDATIGAGSTAARTLFVTAPSSLTAATIPVEVVKLTTSCSGVPSPCPDPAGPSGTVQLNPPGSFVSIVPPDESTDSSSGEVYTPIVVDPSIIPVNDPAELPDGSVSNTGVPNSTVESASMRGASMRGASMRGSDPELASMRGASMRGASMRGNDLVDASPESASMRGASMRGASMRGASMRGDAMTASAITDASYTITNKGNTTATYRIKVVGKNVTEPLELIAVKYGSSPVANPDSTSCELVQEMHPILLDWLSEFGSEVVAPPDGTAAAPSTAPSLATGTLRSSLAAESALAAEAPTCSGLECIADPDTVDDSRANMTLSLEPGASAQITIRGPVTETRMKEITQQLAPVVIAHGGAPNGGSAVAAPLLVTTDVLPDGFVGVTYDQPLSAIGGSGQYTWRAVSAPQGLGVTSDGRVTGRPTAPTTVDTSFVVVEVTDAVRGTTTQRRIPLSVLAGPVTVSLSASPSSSAFGELVTFAASATAATPGTYPAGNLILTIDGQPGPAATMGWASLEAGGFGYSYPTSSLSAGPHTVVASFTSSDGSYLAADATITYTVGKAATAISVLLPPTYPVYGEPSTVTATVTGASGTVPQGTIAMVATPPGSNTGTTLTPSCVATEIGLTCTYSTAIVGAGSYLLRATYAGDDDHLASSLGSTQLVVGKAPVLVTFSPVATTAFGETLPVTVHARGLYDTAPTGVIGLRDSLPSTITFRDGDCVMGTDLSCTFTVASMDVGQHSLAASYAGDANHLPAPIDPPPYVVATVTAAPVTVTLTSSPNPSQLGTVATFVAEVATTTGAVPAGSMALYVDGTPTQDIAQCSPVTGKLHCVVGTSALAFGPHTVFARFIADANFESADALPINHEVTKAATTLLLQLPQASPSYGDAAGITATATSTGGIPTGPIALTATRTDTGAVIPIPAVDCVTTSTSRACSYVTTGLGAGTYTVTAAYAGDATHLDATVVAPQPLSIQPAAVALTIAHSPGVPVFGDPVAVTVTASSTSSVPLGTITLIDQSDAANPFASFGCTASANGLQCSFESLGMQAGSHLLAASYSGDANHLTRTEQFIVQVSRAAPAGTVAFAPAAPKYGDTITLAAFVPAAAANGSVEFSTLSGPLGTATVDQDGKAEIISAAYALPVGATTILARYIPGPNPNYDPGPLTPASFIVAPGDVQVTLTSNPATPWVQGQPVTFVAKIAPASGPTGPAPSGAAVTFSGNGGAAIAPDSCTAVMTGTTTCTLTASSGLPYGSSDVTASFAGDGNYGAGSDTLSGFTRRYASVRAVTSPNPSEPKDTISLSAEVVSMVAFPVAGLITAGNATGTVDFTVSFADGSSLSRTAAVADGFAGVTVSPADFTSGAVPGGRHTVTATYSGDGEYGPNSTSVTHTVSTWVTVAPMPTARRNLAAVALNGKLYALGGNAAPTGVEIYDPATNQWTVGAPMITGRTSHGAAVVDGKIYVVGGSTSNVDVFDPGTNTWTTVAPAAGAYAPAQHTWPAVGVINGKIVVASGTTTVVDVFDPATSTWAAATPIGAARTYGGGAVAGGKLYAIGGSSPPSAVNNLTVEEYDPAREGVVGTTPWSIVAGMPTPYMLFAAAEAKGRIFVAGAGSLGVYSNTFEVFDPANIDRANSASTAPWTTLQPMPGGGRNESAAVELGGRIYVIGGQDASGQLARVEAYDIGP